MTLIAHRCAEIEPSFLYRKLSGLYSCFSQCHPDDHNLARWCFLLFTMIGRWLVLSLWQVQTVAWNTVLKAKHRAIMRGQVRPRLTARFILSNVSTCGVCANFVCHVPLCSMKIKQIRKNRLNWVIDNQNVTESSAHWHYCIWMMTYLSVDGGCLGELTTL